jgi:hypothetical protein
LAKKYPRHFFSACNKMTRQNLLDEIMARELDSEAALAKIVSSPTDDTTMERLDQLVVSAKKADEEVWVILEQSMVAAAKKNGWLAVRSHFEHSEVHDLLKDRITARIAAGIREYAKLDDIVAEGLADVLTSEERTDTTMLNRLVQYGLEVAATRNEAKVKSQMQHIEDLIAGEYVEDEAKAARSVVKGMFAEAGDNVEVMLEELCNKGRLHGMRKDVKTRVHQMAKLKHQMNAFKAAEAKARRMAEDLVRQETDAKLAAELRAAKKERAERERTEREARQAAERQAQQAAEDRAQRERKAAELAERNALKAARLEAQRQEAEDRAARKAIALVQAREEANARRAAKKAEKKAHKVCALHFDIS